MHQPTAPPPSLPVSHCLRKGAAGTPACTPRRAAARRRLVHTRVARECAPHARLGCIVVRSPLNLIKPGLLHGIQRLLGSAFWEVESALVGHEPSSEEPRDILGSNMYGLQLVLQLIGAHTITWGRTVSVAITNSHAGQLQVIAMASLQLKHAGPELVKAIGCDRGSPIVTLSNLAVLNTWRGRGIGTMILRLAQDTALDSFGASENVQPSSPDPWVSENAGALVGDNPVEPSALALMVYRDNVAAVRLYRRTGWEESQWVDPVWLEDVDKFRPRVRPARKLYYKPWQRLKEEYRGRLPS